MNEIVGVTVRFPKELHGRIKTLSKKESRSLNNEILELLKRGLESEVTKQLQLFK